MIEKIFLMIMLFLVSACSRSEIVRLEYERDTLAEHDLMRLNDNVYLLPETPLTLDQIVDIAVCNNLDLYVKELNYEIQLEVANRELFKMLPRLDFFGEFSHRSNSTASRSLVPPLKRLTRPSIGSSQTVKRWDVTLVWNLLDFGLAYYQSQEEQYRAVITYFEYERLKQNLILEVYKSYWRGVASKKGADDAREVLALVKSILGRYERQMANRMLSQVLGLRIEDQMLQIELRLYDLDLLYDQSKAELAGLMGIPAGACFELAPIDIMPLPPLEDVCVLERIALQQRPELYGTDLDFKIAKDEIQLAYLRFLPGAEVFTSYNENKDPFLVHQFWTTAGVRAVWNLLAFPQHVADANAAQISKYRAYQARLAQTISVLAQVHISYVQYKEIDRLYGVQEHIYQVRDRLSKATDAEFAVGEFSLTEVVLALGNAIEGEVNALQAYADLRIGLERINNAIGMPQLYPKIIECE